MDIVNILPIFIKSGFRMVVNVTTKLLQSWTYCEFVVEIENVIFLQQVQNICNMFATYATCSQQSKSPQP